MTKQAAARVVGFLYLFTNVTAIFAYYVRGQMIVRNDVAKTAGNIAASERLFRIEIAAELITVIGVIVLVWALYVVLEAIDRNVALLAVLLRLAENIVLAVTTLNAFAVLALVSGSDYLRGTDPRQLQTIAYTFLRVHGAGYRVGFIFLGLGSAVFSCLWFRSRYIPRALAAWGIFSSLLMAIVTMAIVIFPGLGAMGLFYMLPMGIYEFGLGFWLLIKGLRGETYATH